MSPWPYQLTRGVIVWQGTRHGVVIEEAAPDQYRVRWIDGHEEAYSVAELRVEMDMTTPDPSTPIEEALEALRLAPASYPAVRTFGDLLVEAERGHVEDAVILKALGVEPPKRKAKTDAD